MGLFSWMFGSGGKERDQQRQEDRDRSRQAQERAGAEYSGLKDEYRNLMSGAQAEQDRYKGFLEPQFAEFAGRSDEDHPSYQGYSEFSRTGGISPQDRARLEGYISEFENFGRTRGGVTNADLARLRGNGVYEEFSKTGGYSPEDIAGHRARAGSIVPSMFDSLKRELTRRNTVQSGINPGYTSQMRALGRDTTRETARHLNESELGLQEAIRGGRKWGTEGLTTSENMVQRLLSDNFMQGMRGAADSAMGLTGMTQQGRLAGLSGLSGVRSSTDNARQYGLSGLTGLMNTPSAMERMYQDLIRLYGMDEETAMRYMEMQMGNQRERTPGNLSVGWDMKNGAQVRLGR